MGTLVTAAEEGFVPPGPADFELPPIFGAVTKPMVLVVASAIIIALYFFLASRKLSLVPSKGQFVAESIFAVARNGMARDQIGARDFKPFVPLILGLFSFILVNNLFGLIPFIQFPTMSRIGFPLALALFVYVTYHYAGIRKHGLGGYFKHALFPPGAPSAVYLILAPIEFLSKFVVQPAALFIRVFAAMFAGHLMLMLLAFAGEYLVIEAGGLLSVVGAVSFIGFILMTFIEALIMVIQAYVFAMLAAVFIGAAVAEEH
ncbi:F0F1 ATP synthase subunit A [Pseudonocardia sichuanensis]